VKEHGGNYGNELAYHLAKGAACSSEADITSIKTPKSAIISELKEKVYKCGEENGTPKPRAN
jgi:hypothetical protein